MWKQTVVFKILIAVLLTWLFARCNSNPYPSGDFYVIVISDTHISRDESKVRRLIELSSLINDDHFPGVELLFNTGDVVSRVYGNYTETNPDTTENRLKKAVEIFRNFQIPVYLAMGNHDYKIGPDRDSDTYFPEEEIIMMERIWEKYTGFKPYYVIQYKGWQFIVLNSMRGRFLNRNFDEKQLDWLENQLKNEIPAILLFHHPIDTDHFRLWSHPRDLITTETEPRFFSIIRTNKHKVKGIFVGHGHRWVNDTLFEEIPVYETNSFGDEEELMYYVVGLDNEEGSIAVSKNVMIE